MAQNVTIAGASYEDVPSVDMPTTGGGTSSFYDVSDTTATAADVASGKVFYSAAGVRSTGTASGPEPSSTTPLMDGTAAVGTATTYARADHVHPSDSSKQDLLVSGTNIKTVGGRSLLGSGNISIDGTLPSVSSAQNGMVLMVVDGRWMAQRLPIATDSKYGVVMVDGTTITAAGGVISTASSESYEISIALTNPISGRDFNSCSICYYDGSEGIYPPIDTLTSPSGSTTVTFDPTTYQQLTLEFNTEWGVSMANEPVCTGGVTLAGYDRTGINPIFNVTGSGSITIDGIDYGD